MANAEDLWRPSGIADLEPNAWKALRHPRSTCVLAGPGAGKTEFLAQRASFLLETRLQRTPGRILAISFKTDAAANLQARVSQRCGLEQASRFVSLTFDAFTKGLVDRFRTTIPAWCRPPPGYEIAFYGAREIQDFLTRAQLAARIDWQTAIGGISRTTFESRDVGCTRLRPAIPKPNSGRGFAILEWWNEHLHSQSRGSATRLTFTMINRLAELLVRANPHVQRALRATYPFVFVDEFQDTTYAQYDLLLSLFGGSSTVVTAVGDNRQRIMAWAGARPDVFEAFHQDFGGEAIPLLFNFRSSPDLVRIQHVVAQSLDPASQLAQAQAKGTISGDVAQIWNCETRQSESEKVASWLASDIAARGTHAQHYAILVRQKAEEYEDELAPWMERLGLRIRNESRRVGSITLHLLTDRHAVFCIALLRLAASGRHAEAWQVASGLLLDLRACDGANILACSQAETDLTSWIRRAAKRMRTSPPTKAAAADALQRIRSLVTPEAFIQAFPEYASEGALAIATQALGLHLSACAERSSTWTECLDLFEGRGHVPLMTVHKSKGLEYDTVIFVGLDDNAWWSHSATNPEGKATFFVALSRAKQRAIFTYCRRRGGRQKVADLYSLLANAGVTEIACG